MIGRPGCASWKITQRGQHFGICHGNVREQAGRTGGAVHRHGHAHHRQADFTQLKVGIQHLPVVGQWSHRAVDQRIGRWLLRSASSLPMMADNPSTR